MEREELTEFHYITPINNMRSILKNGVLSHKLAKDIEHDSIAAPEIQDLRAKSIGPQGARLHDYVNLYFHARNPMMYL